MLFRSGIPVGEWLKGPLQEWAEDLLSEQKLKNGGYFDVKQVRKVWEQHSSGKKINNTNYGVC